MQINLPFYDLRYRSHGLCDRITEMAESLKQKNEKEITLDYRIMFRNFNHYTNSEIAYMVFHAIDNFEHEHQCKGDYLSKIELKIKDNSIIIINNDFDKDCSKPTLLHINELDEKKVTVIFRADKAINELDANKYLLSKSFDISDLIKNLENEEKYFLIISAILYINNYDPHLRASVTDSKEDNAVCINIVNLTHNRNY